MRLFTVISSLTIICSYVSAVGATGGQAIS